jgi:UDP-glucose 4-epimerase
MLRNQPIQIYVPFDTIRDYLLADDAAAALISALAVASDKEVALTKIVASEEPTTIAEIISIFKRIARRAPRIVTSASRMTAVYSRRVQFRSVVAADSAPVPRTSLLVGIAQVMAAERAAYMQGRG